jgi:8-oxo-dGTP pyrophosphatase MutT (NUDIX family)
VIEGVLRALRAARHFQPGHFLSLQLGLRAIGWVRRDLAMRLRAWPEVFALSKNDIQLRPAPEADLSDSLADVAQALAREGAIRGWRGETYAVRAREAANAGGEPLFHIERAAMRFFGLTSSAAHLNGFVPGHDNPGIWIARRSATKSIDPGMLDNLVAGGIASGQDAWQALLRECGEEAGIAPALARTARPAGVLSVCQEVPEGLNSEILHLYDLELPADFAPRNTDGEVSEFLRLDAQALLERIARGEMAVEAGLVAVDFALRHGLVADDDGTMGAAVEACRRPTPP